jgi:hypothetical protein
LPSELVASLILDWAWGDKSASEVQGACVRAYRDQEHLLQTLAMSSDHIANDLRAVASLGAWGRIQGNVHRDLVRFLGDPDPPKPLRALIPIKVAKPGRLPVLAEAQVGLLLPHAEFAYMYASRRDVFDHHMLGHDPGSGGTLETFWRGVEARGDPRLEGHPMKARDRWQSLAVPIALHGDAVP